MDEARELLILSGVVVLYAWSAKALDRTWVTAPLFFLAAGFAVGPSGFGWCHLTADASVVHTVAEWTLILLLFSDASRIQLGKLWRDLGLPLRLLAIGLPLTIALGAGIHSLLLPELAFVEAALLAAILAPTDAALGMAVVSSPRVPARIRQTLNVESGLNDGLALPAVIVLASLAADHQGEGSALSVFTSQLTIGPLVGIAVGLLGGWLSDRALRSGWTDRGRLVFVGLGLAAGSYALSTVLGGNGFIATFLCGLVLGNVAAETCAIVHDFLEEEGELLLLASFLLFGVSLVGEGLAHVSLPVVVAAAASLTVMRMLPVSLSLLGSGLRFPTHLFIGWFGPRGLASILFVLAVVEETQLDGAETILSTVVLTVVASTVLHGFTAPPLSRAYGGWCGRLEEGTDGEPVEHRKATEVRLGRRT